MDGEQGRCLAERKAVKKTKLQRRVIQDPDVETLQQTARPTVFMSPIHNRKSRLHCTDSISALFGITCFLNIICGAALFCFQA